MSVTKLEDVRSIIAKIDKIGNWLKAYTDINRIGYESGEKIMVQPLFQKLVDVREGFRDFERLMDGIAIIVIERKRDGKILKEIKMPAISQVPPALLGSAIFELPVFTEDTSCYIYVKEVYRYDHRRRKRNVHLRESIKKEINIYAKGIGNLEVTTTNMDYGLKNEDITISLVYNSNAYKKLYKVTNSISTPSSWIDYTGPIKLFTSGEHYIHYKVENRAGFEKTGYFGPYKIDKDLPTVEASNNDYNISNKDITVELVYKDKDSGIKEKQYGITNSITTPSSWFNYTGPIKLSANGSHYIHYRAVDNVGNVKIGYFGPYQIDKSFITIDCISGKEFTVDLTAVNFKKSSQKAIRLNETSIKPKNSKIRVEGPFSTILDECEIYENSWNSLDTVARILKQKNIKFQYDAPENLFPNIGSISVKQTPHGTIKNIKNDYNNEISWCCRTEDRSIPWRSINENNGDLITIYYNHGRNTEYTILQIDKNQSRTGETIIVKVFGQKFQDYHAQSGSGKLTDLYPLPHALVKIKRKSDNQTLCSQYTSNNGEAAISLSHIKEDTSCYIYVEGDYGREIFRDYNYEAFIEKNILRRVKSWKKDIYIYNYFLQNIININYDSSMLELVDLCSITDKKDMGSITQTEGIITKELSPGIVQIIFNKNIPLDKLWSGFINGIKFKCVKNGRAIIKYSVQ